MMENQEPAITPLRNRKLCGDDVIPMPFIFLREDAFSLTENFIKPYPGQGTRENIIILNSDKCILTTDSVECAGCLKTHLAFSLHDTQY